MPPKAYTVVDQAAGLRRRSSPLQLNGIHCFSGTPDTSVRLARSLSLLGQTTLLIDTQARLAAASTPSSLFGWQHQLERRQLHTVPQPYGEVWHAPGVRADEPALAGLLNHYDHVVFDSGWGGAELGMPPDVAPKIVMEVRHGTLQSAYAVIKTLACRGARLSVGLVGDPSACDHLLAAGCRFLGQHLERAIYSVAKEDDAFAALAVRMADEETSLAAC